MKRKRIFVVLLLVSVACSTEIQYTPDILHVSNPISTIQETIEGQPSDYAYMPIRVEVTAEYMKLYMLESGWSPQAFIVGRPSAIVVGKDDPGLVPTTIYYKNIGKVYLIKSDIWTIEIYDKGGNYLYYVYTFEESEAKRFIDSLYFMMERH